MRDFLAPLLLAAALAACASDEPAPFDGGATPADAGTSPSDAGEVPTDAGDAGDVSTDAAAPPPDAGVEPLSGCPVTYPLAEGAGPPAMAALADRIYVAWADEAGDVHLAHATGTPRAATDWTEAIALPGGAGARPTLLATQDRLHLVTLRSGDWTYAVSGSLTPSGPEDWTTYGLSTRDVQGEAQPELQVHGDGLALLLQRSGSEAELWLTDSTTPGGPEAWSRIAWTDTDRARLAVVGDRLAVVDTPGRRMPTVRVRLADGPAPTAPEDFTTLELDDAARPGATAAAAGTLDGRLVVTWEDAVPEARGSLVAFADGVTPTRPEDFMRTGWSHALARPVFAVSAAGFGLAYETEAGLELRTAVGSQPTGDALERRLDACPVALSESPALVATPFGFAMAALELVSQPAGPTGTNLVMAIGGWSATRGE